MVTTPKEEAVKAFAALGLCDQLAEAAAELGWKAPSKVQEQAIPLLLQGKRPFLSSTSLLQLHFLQRQNPKVAARKSLSCHVHRQRCHRAGTDRVRQDWRFRTPNIAGRSQDCPQAPLMTLHHAHIYVHACPSAGCCSCLCMQVIAMPLPHPSWSQQTPAGLQAGPSQAAFTNIRHDNAERCLRCVQRSAATS